MSRKVYVKISVCFLIVLSCFWGLSAQGNAQSNLEKIIGMWKLISIESVMLPSGIISYDWMGTNPLGLIIYDQTGYMSVQFMKVPRPAFSTARYFDAPRVEINRAFNDYYSYFGTYEINESEAAIVHHVKGSLRPGEVGVVYKRYFKFEGKRLILKTPEQDRDGLKFYSRITFERAEKGK